MNTIEERIEIALRSIERNKNRKNRREKAEKKLAMLIHLRDVVIPQQEAEKEKKRLEKETNIDEETRKKREYYHIQNQKKYWKHHTPIYRTNDMERESREEDLYTEYELKHIEELYPEETGRLSERFWELIDELKKKYAKKIKCEAN